MIIQTIYIWIIWIILRIPNLEIKETLEVVLEDDNSISKNKHSLFYSIIEQQNSITYPKFRVSLIQSYKIIDNVTIIQYDKQQILVLQYNNDVQCTINRTHQQIQEFLLTFKLLDKCKYLTMAQQQRLKNNELNFARKYDYFKIVEQFNHFNSKKIMIVVYQTQIERGVLILEQILDSQDLLLIHEFPINLKEQQNLHILYVAHSQNTFLLIINAKLLYFKQGQILFYKIDQLDELQYSIDGKHLFAMRKSVLYYVKLTQPRAQLIELRDQSNRFQNSGILAFKCQADGILILTQQGQLRHLEINVDESVHKITVYDGIGAILIMIAIFSIKINYF